jgi:hypothetical protein
LSPFLSDTVPSLASPMLRFQTAADDDFADLSSRISTLRGTVA